MSAALKDRRQSRQQAGAQSFEQLLGLDCRLDLGDPLRQLFDDRLRVHFPTPISLRLRAFAGAVFEFLSRVALSRDCRRTPTLAGLVALSVLFGMGHRFFSSACSLLFSVSSVAGWRNSNETDRGLGNFERKLGKDELVLGKSFQGGSRRWRHV